MVTWILGTIVVLLIIAILIPVLYRRVVPTNEVHIVQNSKDTVSYGKDTANGNIYYEWPQWIPGLGIEKIILPVSVFDIDLSGYEAYDKGRLPFVVDIKAFFRVSDSNTAAQRVSSFKELKEQLVSVVQGAVRAILAGSDIEEIMQGRSKFGAEFTAEVSDQLKHWGVEPVKNIELMDLRDSRESQVIHNIMEKKKSFIEMESRQEVARNKKTASITEIESQREVELQEQEAQQQVGIKRTEAERNVAMAEEKKKQDVNETAKITIEKEMSVKQVQLIKQADIEREVEIVKAQQQKQVAEIHREAEVIKAEQERQTEVINADARLQATEKKSKGIELEGDAVAKAEQAKLLAPVEAQVRLAKEIGQNKSYQEYLIKIEEIKANKEVGMEQASALGNAEIKIIANAGDVNSGIQSAREVLTPKGGTQLGAMLEGFINTDVGKKIVDKFTSSEEL